MVRDDESECCGDQVRELESRQRKGIATRGHTKTGTARVGFRMNGDRLFFAGRPFSLGPFSLGPISLISGTTGRHGVRDAEKTFLDSFSTITDSYA